VVLGPLSDRVLVGLVFAEGFGLLRRTVLGSFVSTSRHPQHPRRVAVLVGSAVVSCRFRIVDSAFEGGETNEF
jgi:hypothetical protein